MTRLSIVLLVMVLVSALYQVRVQYDSRRLFTELERAQNEAKSLESDRRRLDVERRAAAMSLRVDTLARQKLDMHEVTPPITEYVSWSAPRAAVDAEGRP